MAGAFAWLVASPRAVQAQSVRKGLNAVAEAYWQASLDHSPETATILGFPGSRNTQLTDRSPRAQAAWNERLRGFLRQTDAFDERRLDRAGRVNLALLREELAGRLARSACRFELWRVDQLDGPQVEFATLAALQPIATPAKRAQVLARWRRMGPYFDQQVANLRRGLDSGYVAARINVERVTGQLDRLLADSVDASPFMAPARRAGKAEQASFTPALRAIVRDQLYPGLIRYRDFLRDIYLPRSRGEPGVSGIPGGAECYRALIRWHTSLDLPADSIHRIGLGEVASIRAEMAEITRRHFRTENLDSLLRALPADSTLTFESRAAVFDAARQAVGRMERKLPQLFGRLPRRQVRVEEMPAYQEQDAPAAYYYPGTADGRRPGRYLVNTYQPRQRPRYTAEVLAFHEAVPGHHLQIGLAQELPLPAFRRFGQGNTALVEGWALYTERLADEAGMYSGDLDRLGMLIFQSWRACRLVIDTGLHTQGWSRQQAIEFLLANTGLSRLDAENEVDRYIVDPGQALAYKLGQREILQLREEARRALGDRFDLRAYHDVVLADGAVTLPVLAANVRAWVAAQKAQP